MNMSKVVSNKSTIFNVDGSFAGCAYLCPDNTWGCNIIPIDTPSCQFTLGYYRERRTAEIVVECALKNNMTWDGWLENTKGGTQVAQVEVPL